MRYIDVSRNIFSTPLVSYPESNLIIGSSFTVGQNVIYASSMNPNSGTSWWGGGQGCDESQTNITINNGCNWDAANCFGQNLTGDRFLFVYVRP